MEYGYGYGNGNGNGKRGSSKKGGTSFIVCAMEWACHLLTIASLSEP